MTFSPRGSSSNQRDLVLCIRCLSSVDIALRRVHKGLQAEFSPLALLLYDSALCSRCICCVTLPWGGKFGYISGSHSLLQVKIPEGCLIILEMGLIAKIMASSLGYMQRNSKERRRHPRISSIIFMTDSYSKAGACKP